MIARHRRHRFYNPATAGATVAIDARFLTGLADGDAVGTWTARPGTSVSPTEATNKPTYKASVVNGLPAVRFASASSTKLEASVTITGNATFFMVGVCVSGQAYARYVSTGRGGNDYDDPGAIIPFQASGNQLMYSWSNYSYNVASASYSTPLVASCVTDSQYGSLRVNGGTAASLFVQSLNIDRLSIGRDPSGSGAGGSIADGDMCAVVVVPSTVSDALRRRIEQSLAFSFRIACA